ncbi:MAG: hypothetical protein C5B57_08920 [Blastocatellia bacterium]|nr:MAG: hypothetical protein C5B57_08920 [Blastocatellia bacterium]
MRTWVGVLLFVLGTVSVGSELLFACGDKFLLVGRGVRFQKAYAAIHPASILIVVPPKAVKNAAVRDSRLVTALKMAGHQVEVVQQPADLTNVLGRSTHDIVLAERADASTIPAVTTAGRAKPTVVAVLEDPSSSELAAARQQLEVVLKTPQPLSQILSLIDDVMSTRLGKPRATAGD